MKVERHHLLLTWRALNLVMPMIWLVAITAWSFVSRVL